MDGRVTPGHDTISETFAATTRVSTRSPPIIQRQGAKPGHLGKLFVAARCINQKMVNRSAPELFPLILILKNSFIRRKMRSGAALSGRQ
jgi:hypothetical protein